MGLGVQGFSKNTENKFKFDSEENVIKSVAENGLDMITIEGHFGGRGKPPFCTYVFSYSTHFRRRVV